MFTFQPPEFFRRRPSQCLMVGVAALVSLTAGAATEAGVSVLVVDKIGTVAANHKIWRMSDDDNSGTIEPSEIHVWFDITNPNGLSMGTPFAFAIRPIDNAVLFGDLGATTRGIYLLKDVNHNGDALSANESRLVLSNTNASGASVTTPSGVSFFPGFDLAYVNAGNGSGPDAIYRLHDANSNGSYDEAGEAAQWVTTWSTFGTGNTSFSPQEIVFDAIGNGYVRNSNSAAPGFGIWRFRDVNGNGRADDAGEFTVWFDNTNFSGVTLSAGFVMELDLAHAHAIYTNQTVSITGGTRKQIIRLTDLDNNGDANGSGEAVIVYTSDEAGMSIQDVISVPNGDLYFTDLTGKRIFRLHDLDNDGLFIGPGERTEFLSNASATTAGVGEVRYFGWLRDISTCAADFNASGGLSVQDIFDFLNAWFNGDPRADFNNVGGLNIQDIFDFLNAWFLGCP